MKTNIAAIAIASTLAGACDESESTPVSIEDVTALESRVAELPANVKDHHGYFRVRQDLRACAYPACGGWFLSEVNYDLMVCPEGDVADECYVPELLSPEGVAIEDGDLLHGEFGTADILGDTWGTFDADFAYASALENPWPFGSHDLIFNTGIVCIVAPCPSTALAHLNSDFGLESFDWLFWGADADEDAILEAAFSAEYAADASEPGGGALTLGDFWLFFGDVYYSVYNVYTLRTPQTPVCVVADDANETTAWTFDDEAAAQGLLAALTGTVEILEGTCGEQLLICPAVYEPVHGGIDANGGACETANNGCEFRSAVIAAAGEAKAKGSFTPGPC